MALTQKQLVDRRLLFRPCKTREEVQDWVHYFLDLELPGNQVDEESNSSPLDMVWDVYARLVHGEGGSIPPKSSQVLYYSCREGGKSLSESVIEVLLLLHFRAPLIHLAAIERQSLDVRSYIDKFFSNAALKGFVSEQSKRSLSVSFYIPDKELQNQGQYILTEKEFLALPVHLQDRYRKITNKLEVIVAEMASVNGKHGILLMDELDVLEKPNVFKECPNIPSQVMLDNGDIRLPLTIYTSTRKTSFGLVQNLITKAKDPSEDFDLEIRHWNIIDKTERCPEDRHRPDLPKLPLYVSKYDLKAVTEDNYKALPSNEKSKFEKMEAYHGCHHNCKIFAACQGRLATRQTSDSKFLNRIDTTQAKFRTNDLETALAQLMCYRPYSGGLVYSKFNRDRHVLTPAQAYNRITGDLPKPNMTKDELMQFLVKMFPGCWYGGMDFGYSHNFAYAHGIQLGNVMYITHVEAGAELDPEQKMNLCAPYKTLNPNVYPDPENPDVIKIFRKNGWRMIRWKKTPGSVHGGIAIVRLKLAPMNKEDPELFFIRDIGMDPRMDLALRKFEEHHWKLDASGLPTNNVSDIDKDIPDAIRYLVMNRFSVKGQPLAPADVAGANGGMVDMSGNQIYTEENWLPQKVAEIIGLDFVTQQELNPGVQMDQSYDDYYSSVVNGEGVVVQTKGKTGGFLFDMG